jgi:hypothetical protein
MDEELLSSDSFCNTTLHTVTLVCPTGTCTEVACVITVGWSDRTLHGHDFWLVSGLPQSGGAIAPEGAFPLELRADRIGNFPLELGGVRSHCLTSPKTKGDHLLVLGDIIS